MTLEQLLESPDRLDAQNDQSNYENNEELFKQIDHDNQSRHFETYSIEFSPFDTYKEFNYEENDPKDQYEWKHDPDNSLENNDKIKTTNEPATTWWSPLAGFLSFPQESQEAVITGKTDSDNTDAQPKH